MAKDFGTAVNTARDAGFDCVEVHAGHGYLISQFLSPYTNRRRDEFGGSLENRMTFMKMCLEEVMKSAGSDMGVLVKTNMRDGFKGGLEIDDCLAVAGDREMRCARHGAFRRFCQQGSHVCDARAYACLFHDPLHETAVAQIWGASCREIHDTLRAVQGALFP